VRGRSCAEGEFRNQQAALRDFAGKSGVALRINHIDTGAQHRDGRARPLQAAAMRRGVDT
jgi:hypothetical protein